MAIEPRIDPQSLHGKILAVIHTHAIEGIWGTDIIGRVGFDGRGDKVIDALYEMMEQGLIKKQGNAWHPIIER